MTRQRPAVQAFTADGPILVALLDVIGDLHDLLDARLPRPAEQVGGGPVRIAEPAPAGPPAKAEPVSEPAPEGAPSVPDGEPEKVSEPGPDLPEPPPRAGRGSGLDAWQTFAGLNKVGYAEDASRNDIIAACVAAGVIDE